MGKHDPSRVLPEAVLKAREAAGVQGMPSESAASNLPVERAKCRNNLADEHGLQTLTWAHLQMPSCSLAGEVFEPRIGGASTPPSRSRKK